MKIHQHISYTVRLGVISILDIVLYFLSSTISMFYFYK